MTSHEPEAKNPAEDTVDHSRFWTWERVIGVAVLVQLGLIIAVAVYFAIITDQQNAVLASNTIAQAKQNSEIISEVRGDVALHARASADRVCGVAELLDYLASTSPLERSDKQIRDIHKLVHKACLFVPPHLAIGGP